MNCKCGGTLEMYRGLTEGTDYWECNKCGNRIYTEESNTLW
jgi:DNA-directed RNA polymerase subunit RPC12/RpoP